MALMWWWCNGETGHLPLPSSTVITCGALPSHSLCAVIT
jgi:hypothetical protein